MAYQRLGHRKAVRVLLAVVLLTCLAFAGCSSGGAEDGEDTSSSSASSSGTGSKSGTKSGSGTASSSGTGTGQPSNKAPTGRLAASVANGTTPLSVNFTLEGSDADGDALSWSLAFGDGASENGTALPANVTHAFAAAGNYTVTYNLTDGKASASYNVTIRVAAGGPGGGSTTAVFTEAQEYPSNPVNSLVIPNVGYAGATGCAGYWDGTSGVDCVFFELEAAWAGKAFTATADAGNPDLEFWPVCDPTEVFAVAGFNAAGPESGAIPSGALCVVIWNGEPGIATPTHTFTIA